MLTAGLVAGWLARGTPAPPPEARVLLAAESTAVGIDPLAMTPDGTRVAEVSQAGIRLRSLGDISWRLLPDTQGAGALTFDAAGARVYFGRGTEVLSTGIDGSSPLAEATFDAGTLIDAGDVKVLLPRRGRLASAVLS